MIGIVSMDSTVSRSVPVSVRLSAEKMSSTTITLSSSGGDSVWRSRLVDEYAVKLSSSRMSLKVTASSVTFSTLRLLEEEEEEAHKATSRLSSVNPDPSILLKLLVGSPSPARDKLLMLAVQVSVSPVPISSVSMFTTVEVREEVEAVEVREAVKAVEAVEVRLSSKMSKPFMPSARSISGVAVVELQVAVLSVLAADRSVLQW